MPEQSSLGKPATFRFDVPNQRLTLLRPVVLAR